MERDDSIDKTITMTEIGLSVLTLSEVLQTFAVDSAMFNIKLNDLQFYRTVVLKKNIVEIDGKNKVIIMIRDVSDKIRIEQEQIKKEKDKANIVYLKQNLDDVFVKHCAEVEALYSSSIL